MTFLGIVLKLLTIVYIFPCKQFYPFYTLLNVTKLTWTSIQLSESVSF